MRELCPIYYGATYEKMADLAYIQWPCPTEDSPGTQYLYEGGKFDTPNGKGQFYTCEWAPLLINSLMSSQWYWQRFVKLDITLVVQ